ncbi:RagB/SusD family nutrient uptake outer membrane protein [Chitinophaga sp. 22321]|uniref:RagB/SusD family nutrient uptake outer membrane protein n=1 Tax=Chitinophaga hostae TaxID=2831022 RepID=A0ABS5J7Z6_9BACT|nr:RagB/SusD family nutrient uptake outer membrane protein [Chitinophaga hostae]MBS0031319.1 RagB/SusD family nutrient uptake outer membrane protein [Chitinophaga hostae]
MKTLRYLSVVLALATVGISACKKSFLERDPIGSLSDEIVANKAGINYLLIGAYAALDGQQTAQAALGGGGPWEASPTNWIYGSVAGGDAHKGSFSGDQPGIDPIAKFTVDASNGFFNTKWRAVYEGVTRSNTVLSKLKEATDMSAAEKTQVEAEARFLRGHYYFELRKMFNKVPYISDTTLNPRIKNDKEIWPFIEADFKFATDNLPPTQSDVARANKWAAQIYLAKTYLYQKKYTEAMPLFDQAITSGVTSNGIKYKLTDAFEDNFDAAKKNNSESVFAIQMTANDGTNTIANANQGEMLNFPYNSPFGCCGFYQPTQDLVNSYRTNATTGLPDLDNYNTTPVKNDQGILSSTAFVPETGTLDPRLDWTVGRRGLPYHDWGNHPGASWIRDQAYAGPYAPKKMVYWQFNQDKYKDAHSWAPGSAINVLLIRFADVLLMSAECHAQTGDLPGATALVNQIRDRMINHPENWLHKYKDDTKPLQGFDPTKMAANYKIGRYATTFASKDFALKAIYFERKLELATEGHRFFDLVRWGIADAALNAFITYESAITTDLRGGHFTKGKNEYFPVPQRQIDLTIIGGERVLDQNPNY